MKTLLLVSSLVVWIMLLGSPSFSDADSAYEELENANSGDQSTSKTFDNSDKPQTIDAYPRNNTSVETPTGTSVERSTEASGGYSVEKSTRTETPEPEQKPLQQPR